MFVLYDQISRAFQRLTMWIICSWRAHEPLKWERGQNSFYAWLFLNITEPCPTALLSYYANFIIKILTACIIFHKALFYTAPQISCGRAEKSISSMNNEHSSVLSSFQGFNGTGSPWFTTVDELEIFYYLWASLNFVAKSVVCKKMLRIARKFEDWGWTLLEGQDSSSDVQKKVLEVLCLGRG